MAVNNEKQCKILYKPDSLSKLLSLFLYIKRGLVLFFPSEKKRFLFRKFHKLSKLYEKKSRLVHTSSYVPVSFEFIFERKNSE